jgi:hypothetical protein
LILVLLGRLDKTGASAGVSRQLGRRTLKRFRQTQSGTPNTIGETPMGEARPGQVLPLFAEHDSKEIQQCGN